MPRIVNKDQRRKKEMEILEAVRLVFCRKGLSNVTMKDLIDATGMSRGGFYFYYQSVDEVFRAMAEHRAKSKFEEILHSIEDNPDFDELLDAYFSTQIQRLLHMDNSMIRAMYEYLFTHRGENDHTFRDAQVDKNLETVRVILELGVRQGKVNPARLKDLTQHVMVCIEGLNALCMFGALSTQRLEAQFQLLKDIIV